MNLQQRKELLKRLGSYLLKGGEEWEAIKQKAYRENQWFLPEFTERAARSIAENFLTEKALNHLIERYDIPEKNDAPLKIGIVMAGNIPLVGFHDLLCVVLSGNLAIIKPSSKDNVLTRFVVEKMADFDPDIRDNIHFQEMLRNCDAYIATGSNNSARYFEYYFGRYPSIIRRSRTSIAILTGQETRDDLEKLADDVFLYFGLGCRNVSKLYVPRNYDFIPLLEAFNKYQYLADHNKFKNNYDYYLAIHMLNRRYYMTNGFILLIEDNSIASPIGQLHYEYFDDYSKVLKDLESNEAVQCIVATDKTGFGEGQTPDICDYADGIDTMQFLRNLTGKADLRKP